MGFIRPDAYATDDLIEAARESRERSIQRHNQYTADRNKRLIYDWSQVVGAVIAIAIFLTLMQLLKVITGL